jgi:hypothetical protein
MDAFIPKPGAGSSKSTTFSKAQRKQVAQGAKKVDDQDKAMWATITHQRMNPIKKVLLAITFLTSGIQGAIGQVTSFVDTGQGAHKVGKDTISELNYKVEQEDPSLIYLHVPYAEGTDNETNASHAILRDWTLDQMDGGRICIIADTRHTARWGDAKQNNFS